MNKRLQSILNLLQQSESLTPEEKKSLADAVNESDKEISIIEFKLERTEKVKRTTAILLEQTIAELEQKRKSVEAQNRELEIEASLERVRSRAMGMRTSDELNELIGTVFTELTKLDFSLTRCVIMVYDLTTNNSRWWMANSEDPHHPMNFVVQDHDHEPNKAYINAWQEQRIKWTYELKGTVKKNWDEFLFSETQLSRLPDFVIAGMKEPERVFLNASFNNFGNLTLATLEPLSDRHFEIMLRFAKVFDLTYTRFNDLKQAEAQAREAKIEAALERVRARTMAMQKSDELADVAGLMFQQVKELGISTWTTGFNVWSDDNSKYTDYVTSPLGGFIEPYTIETSSFPSFKEIREAKERGEEFYVQYLEGDVLKQTYLELSKFGDKDQYVKMREGGFEFPTRQFDHFVFLSNISLMFITYDPVPEAHDVFKRFGKVFEQTYTRFLDLQKAEAQAREAKIDTALERVRSKTMAMHSSDDVGDTVVTMFDELVKLGVRTNRCGILIHSDSVYTEVWTAKANQDEKATLIVGTLDITMHKMLSDVRNSWVKKEAFFSYELVGEDIKNYYRAINNSKTYRYPIDIDALPSIEIHSDFHFREGSIFAFTAEPIAEEAIRIFHRFAGVFGQTYTRFLDLKKAEGQAREAKIEASLERVRGKAMAMHSSADLAATVRIFYRELESFSITPRRCGVGVVDRETRIAEISTMNTTDKGDSIEVIGKLKMVGHPVLEGIFDSWISQQEYHPVLRGNEIKEYYQLVRPQISFPEYPNDAVQFGYFFPVPELSVYAWTDKELAEDELKIYRKFTSVLNLTYKRYQDLKDAEFRAKEAVKQATLDRVRAEIASMRTKQDLDRITPLIWNELTILGIPFVRCGVFIMDDTHKQVHTFLSTPDGRAIAAFQLDYSVSNLKEMISHWHDRFVYVTHWGAIEFGELANILMKQGSIVSRDQYLNTLPAEGIYLHFLPFLQGMLYVGNTTRLQQDDIHLLQSLAEAFSTAYARYDDFNKLEAAKQQVDRALIELKQTQQQLVQAEKMASLGELTAGIAHEIQNPLNFVNNFSEVSNELIDEMMEEVEKGNFNDATIIANDLKQNLQKINHHGKRADGIVKSMLQHSRSSSGQKELTDMNVLADEYLRLAYHGLRAKDKTFNAKFETNFDSTLEKIAVIPQDIGRVILNLINNAFYAVTEKRKTVQKDYEPTVSINTKKLNGKIEITVKDNGTGIPQKAFEKIFQPFFTTKPAGHGTGLGLSLSYDILKAHGGELKVETKEGVGTEFSIQLPIS
ncbi:MAG TPA: ATP-binding protein [Chryseolinea sp.]